ncbi:MAG: NAD(P)/FAD-dependent oxidoreductase [bacterium]|nr:NAD(P)/FAD-dependent oxidoreductase [bacterium]
MARPRPHVAVVGAGFAGLSAVKALRGAGVDVTLIDQRNYHTFQPLLYQVATAGLDAGDVAHQVRDVLRNERHARFRMGRVVAIDLAARTLAVERSLGPGPRDTIGYDHLVLAPGAVYHDFGVPGVHEHAFVLKSVAEAVALRAHLLRRFERAARDASLGAPPESLDVVLVGAGPTGVEMAGALVELFQRVLPRDYPELDLSRAQVRLLEALPHVLTPYHPATRAYVERVLRSRGVDVRTESQVRAVTADTITLADGTTLPHGTLVWAAGVRAHPLAEALAVPLDRAGRIPVHDDLSLPDHPEVWVAGDVAGPVGRGPGGATYPQVAQVAKQQGQHVARSLRARLAGRSTRPFHYVDLGLMAIVGRSAGVAELSPALGGLRFRGLLGWLAWLFIHLVHLPGHQNRLRAFIGWAFEWFTYDRHARLILDPLDRTLDRAGPPPPVAPVDRDALAVSAGPQPTG